MICCRDVDTSSATDVAENGEKGGALQLKGFHTEVLFAKIGVHVPAIQDEPLLACSVKGNSSLQTAERRSGRCKHTAA